MQTRKLLPAALLAGALAGALVLGLVGRAATAGLAYAIGQDTNLSLRGLIEVLMVGLLVGGVGGLLLLPVRRLFPASRTTRNLALGILLFAGSSLAVFLRGRPGFAVGGLTLVTAAVVAAVYVLYAFTADALLGRLQPGDRLPE